MAGEIVVLRDGLSGSSAEIAAGLGFNCFRFTAMPGGRPVEVLYSHPEFAGGNQRPSGSGIPILFPFPGRIPGTTFEWEGKKYELEPGDALGNAIHGFVHKRPWRVIEQSESRVVGQFHAWRDDPSLKDRWPADFRITATYQVQGNALRSEYLLENPGESPLPWGFGTHPYFRLPLGGPSADDCIVRLPVTARWELADMLPTGRRLELPDADQHQAGKRFGDLKLDDVFTGLTSGKEDFTIPSIEDPNAKTWMCIIWRSAQFRECVVYTPPHREAICIEPLTCAPSAAMLAARGIDAGWKVLQPGESVQVEVMIDVREYHPVASGKK
jgi:aldose 1-epimerase